MSPARSKQKRCGGGSKSNNQLTSSVDNSNSNTEYNDLSSSSSLATQRKPASLAGVTEDHRYEQFFYNEQTSNELYQLVELYNRPILLCNPTLAVLAEKKGPNIQIIRSRYTVQIFLSGYEQFSLAEPHLIANYEHDAIFIDPPFANITPIQIATCLQIIIIVK